METDEKRVVRLELDKAQSKKDQSNIDVVAKIQKLNPKKKTDNWEPLKRERDILKSLDHKNILK